MIYRNQAMSGNIFDQYRNDPRHPMTPHNPAGEEDGQQEPGSPYMTVKDGTAIGIRFKLNSGWVVGYFYTELANPVYHERFGIIIRDMTNSQYISITGEHLDKLQVDILRQRVRYLEPRKTEKMNITGIALFKDAPEELPRAIEGEEEPSIFDS